ncbi:MAG: hypothetical protein ACR2QW_10080, partial [bacterium]
MEILAIVLALLLGASVVFNLIQSKNFAGTGSKGYAITPHRSGVFFPYLCSNKKYTTWLLLCNRSEHLTKTDFEFRDQKGKIAKKFSKSLKPHECMRYNEANFEGSVNIVGWGGDDAIYA